MVTGDLSQLPVLKTDLADVDDDDDSPPNLLSDPKLADVDIVGDIDSVSLSKHRRAPRRSLLPPLAPMFAGLWWNL